MFDKIIVNIRNNYLLMTTSFPFLKRVGRYSAFAFFGSCVWQEGFARRNQILYSQTEFNKQLVQGTTLHQDLKYYRSPLLISRSISQLLWLGRVKPDFHAKVEYDRQVLQMTDGGTMTVDWYWPDELNGSNTLPNDQKHPYKVIIVMPGIGGDSSKSYMKVLCRYFIHRGTFKGEKYIVGVLQARGNGGELMKSTQFADFSKSADWQEGMQ